MAHNKPQNDNKPHQKSQKISFKLIFVIIILGCFVGVFIRTLTYKPDMSLEALNKNMPVFSLPSLADNSVYISNEDIKENAPALLNVWASWCAPCRNEHKFISQLSKEHNIKIFGLNYKDKAENGQSFLKKYGNPFFKAMNDADGLTTLNWGIRGVPETFIINKQGKITYRHTGEIRQKDIATILKAYNEALN
ncbi:MAG: cytochrome c biogenesis protein CcmG/thiol:disulfide interchange protein DsbE [Alphaproteobacteria bacterium]|jgi:cytochrome c biogenesis protein CcmG/thiol:disulfide interchange protein DsbE